MSVEVRRLWPSRSLQRCLWLQNSLPKHSFGFTDGLAYSALLKNELLGAGIEKVQDPQTEDRRLQPSTPEKKSLFTVSWFAFKTKGVCVSRVVRAKHVVLSSCSCKRVVLRPY